MENIIFWAKNDEEAKQITIDDFVNKASKVLECYKDILETWIEHTPHILFYECYESMFSGKGGKWLSNYSPSNLETITSSEYLGRIESCYSEKDLRSIMGGGEVPFIYLEKVEDNKYQYHIGR